VTEGNESSGEIVNPTHSDFKPDHILAFGTRVWTFPRRDLILQPADETPIRSGESILAVGHRNSPIGVLLRVLDSNPVERSPLLQVLHVPGTLDRLGASSPEEYLNAWQTAYPQGPPNPQVRRITVKFEGTVDTPARATLGWWCVYQRGYPEGGSQLLLAGSKEEAIEEAILIWNDEEGIDAASETLAAFQAPIQVTSSQQQKWGRGR